MMWRFFVLNLLAFGAARLIELPSDQSEDNGINNRPLIGILSQPGDGDGHRYINQLPPHDPRRLNISYIAASYVKFVEAGGARVVPLIYNEPHEQLRKKFASINGIIFPGGGSSLKEGPFYEAGELLFRLAIEANDKGDYFPLWGTCLGFELLTVIISKNQSILEHFDALNFPAPLVFVDDHAKHSSVFKWIPEEIIDKLTTQNLTMENHAYGMSPRSWESNAALTTFFRVLTTTPDHKNRSYISTVEARNYPITAVQWHPEKNAFEWGLDTIPHTPDAIRITQSAATFLVSEARKSSHRPYPADEEDNLLIYNYSPLYSGFNRKGGFDQSYVFC